MTCAVFAFGESSQPAARLATWLGAPFFDISSRRFPDGERLVRAPASATVAIVYRSLDNPDSKLFELLLAASALRDLGARRVILVAPYLAYMRQDVAFSPGEAVSQKVIGRLIAEHFDALVTVDPHLHRITSLSEAVPHIPVLVGSAASALSEAISPNDHPLLVGPDKESRQWLSALAKPHGLEFLLGAKDRQGDRNVKLAIEGIERAAGRRVVIVDDVVSSGTTLVECARQLGKAGARQIEAAVTHCLAGTEDLDRLRAAGISRLIASDSVPGPHAIVHLAPLIGRLLQKAKLLTD